MEDQIWPLEKHGMKNSYDKKIFSLHEKKLYNKNISF